MGRRTEDGRKRLERLRSLHLASVHCRIGLGFKYVERVETHEAACEAQKRDGRVPLTGREPVVSEVLDKCSDAARIPRRTLATGATLARHAEGTFGHRFRVEPFHAPMSLASSGSSFHELVRAA